jgi:hypothetical protein
VGAEPIYRAALRLRPDYPEAHNNTLWHLAAGGGDQLRPR